MRKICSLLILLTVIATQADAQLNYVYNKRLNEVFDSVCNKFNIKGATAAVVVPNEGIWERCHGVSHGNVAITSDVHMGIGSNTKTYVSALLLKLQEKGKLSLDDTIGTWIKNEPNIPGNITIRQMLNHTSGLYSFTFNPDINNYILPDYTKVWPPDSVINLVKAPTAAPGGPWDYCNTGYVIAGMIIRDVMGQPVYKTLRDELLTPHGLSETYFYPYETPANIPHTWSDVLSSGNMEDMMAVHNYSHNAFLSLAYTAGAIMATAKDNALFWDKLMSGQIINSSSLAEMETLVPVSSGQGYGLGIFELNGFNGRKVVSHGGTNFGFINDNIHDKTSGVTITVLTNQDSIHNGIILNYLIKAMHQVTMRYTGIEVADNNQGKVNIYPNPATDRLNINIQHADASAEMYNITGQRVLAVPLTKGANTIPLPSVPSGSYYISIISEQGAIHRQTIQIVH